MSDRLEFRQRVRIPLKYFREPTAENAKVGEAPPSMLIPLWLLVAATIYFGIDTSLTVDIAGRAAEALLAGGR